MVGRGDAKSELASCVGRFVFEPHAAVLAASLAKHLANELRLQRLIPGGGYLTADQLVADTAVASFEVLESLPYRLKTLKSALKSFGAGRVELKHRGISLPNHDQVASQIQGSGDNSLVVLLMRRDRSISAIIARRIVSCEGK